MHLLPAAPVSGERQKGCHIGQYIFMTESVAIVVDQAFPKFAGPAEVVDRSGHDSTSGSEVYSHPAHLQVARYLAPNGFCPPVRKKEQNWAALVLSANCRGSATGAAGVVVVATIATIATIATRTRVALCFAPPPALYPSQKRTPWQHCG